MQRKFLMAPHTLLLLAQRAALTSAMVLFFGAASQAFAKTDSPSSNGKEKAIRKPASKTTYRPSPSEETRAERERRLKRECSSKPNAGACAGFGYGSK